MERLLEPSYQIFALKIICAILNLTYLLWDGNYFQNMSQMDELSSQMEVYNQKGTL